MKITLLMNLQVAAADTFIPGRRTDKTVFYRAQCRRTAAAAIQSAHFAGDVCRFPDARKNNSVLSTYRRAVRQSRETGVNLADLLLPATTLRHRRTAKKILRTLGAVITI